MKNRLTVSQIMHTQSTTQATTSLQVSSLFLNDDYIFLIDKKSPSILRQISLKTFELTNEILLPQRISQNKMVSLVQFKGFIVVALENCKDLFVRNGGCQFQIVRSHMDAVSYMICYRGMLATCSDDMTVRVWNFDKTTVSPNIKRHIYSGHTGRITCLEKYQNLLISGSIDKRVIFWANHEQIIEGRLNSSIKSILSCSLSDQLAIFSQKGQISIVNMKSLINRGKFQISRTIQSNFLDFSTNRFCNEIDDSFILFTTQNKIVFVQINLGEIIHEKQLSQSKDHKIMGIKTMGRLLLYGTSQENLYFLKI